MKKHILLILLSDLIGTQALSSQIGKPDALWNNGRGTQSDGKDTNAKQAPTRQLSAHADSLIVYFSRSGSTEQLAYQIQAKTQADILELVMAEPYPSQYDATVTRATEEREQQHYPELSMNIPDLNQYQSIYLGYPVWGISLSSPMYRFLADQQQQLNGKKLIPFATHGGYGLGKSIEQIQTLAPNSQILLAYSIQGNRVDQAENSLQEWLDRLLEK